MPKPFENAGEVFFQQSDPRWGCLPYAGFTVSALQSACAGATVGEGLSVLGVTAQNARGEAQAAVDAWL